MLWSQLCETWLRDSVTLRLMPFFSLLSSPAYSCPSASSPGIRDQALGYGNPPPLYHPLPRPRSCLRGPNRFTHQPLLKRAWLSFSRLQSVFFQLFIQKQQATGGCSAFRITYFTLRARLCLWKEGVSGHTWWRRKVNKKQKDNNNKSF